MHTEHVDIHLPDFVNGKLDEELKETVESHLRACVSCRLEEKRVREVVASLRGQELHAPPPSYFPTILPRVRGRLNRVESPSFLSHPLASTLSRLIGRLALPLAAAAVALVLLIRFPVNPETAGSALNAMKVAVDGLSSDELAQAVLAEARQHPFVSSLGDHELAAAVPDKIVEQHLFTKEFYSQVSEVAGPLFDVTPSQTIEGLSDSEVDALLQRLAERTTL